MSLKVHELIKKVRACKTAEEERSIINKESAEMRNISKDALTNVINKRNLLKCIYMHLMGYSTTFIQVATINLLASSNFTEKRIAYLCLGLLLDEKSEVLLLSTQSIKKDLDSSNLSIVSLALNAVGESCTADMCRELASEIGRLMSSSYVFLKKKAALACIKIIKKCPELTETFVDHLPSYFDYKNHGVLLAGCALANEIFKADHSQAEKFTKYTGVFVRHLKNLISSNYSSEFDVNGVTDPFLQCQMLCILKHFGRGNREISEEMKDIISDISTSAESSKLTSNAVQYELVKTIIGIESDTSMKALASNILGKLLQSKDNNYKYISLNTMREVIRTDISSVQKHRNIILDCLKDSDISICRRALELTYMIINNSNVKQIVKELLNFLMIAADEFKLELTKRISQSVINYGTSVKWQIDNLIKMLCMSGNFFSEDSVSSIINLIISNEELKLYSVHKVFLALKNYVEQEALAKVAVYVIGEYGNFLVTNSVIGPEDEQIIVTENEVITVLRKVENSNYSNSSVYEFLMNSYIKLSTKFSQESSKLFKQFISEETTSFYFEVQQRAVEYAAFDQVVNENLKSQLTKNIPIAKTHNKRLDVAISEDNENVEIPAELDRQLLIKYSNGQNDSNTTNKLITYLNPTQSKNVNLLEDLDSLFIGNPVSGSSNLNMPDQNKQNSSHANFPDGMHFSQLPTNNSNKISSNHNTNQFDLLSGIVNAHTVNNNQFNGNQLIDLSKSSPTNNRSIVSANQDNSLKVKQFYRNKYITLSYTSNLNQDGSYYGFFYVSNFSDQVLSNFNLKFMVLSFLNFKVLSSSGSSLEPYQSQGINKEYHLVNSKPDKKIIIKIKFSYNLNNQEISDTITFENFN